MMSSTMWVCPVLSPATLRPGSGTTRSHCVTRPVAVPVWWAAALGPGCSHTEATRLVVLPSQSC
jgi:hypothetical protein